MSPFSLPSSRHSSMAARISSSSSKASVRSWDGFLLATTTTALIILIILVVLLPSADAFASNLIVTTMGCMTELSTDEVIMNNVVKAPDESDFPEMHLQILDKTLEDEITIAFVNPYSTDEFHEDIQFVMEVGLVDEKEENEEEAPASFTSGGTIGCENNKRVAARYMDNQGQVTLKLEDPTIPMKVWAGWATGQNPVRLVPELLLLPVKGDTQQKDDAATAEDAGAAEGPAADTKEDANVATDAKDPSVKEDSVPANDQAAKPLKKILSNLQKEVPEELHNVKDGHHNTKQKIARKDSSNNNNSNQDLIKDKVKAQNIAENIKKKQKELDLKAEQKRRRDAEQEEDSNRDDDKAARVAAEMKRKRQESDAQMKAHRAKLEAQMRRNFGGSSSDDLDTVWHLVGCGFFVVCIAIFWLVFGKKRADKGRRDL